MFSWAQKRISVIYPLRGKPTICINFFFRPTHYRLRIHTANTAKHRTKLEINNTNLDYNEHFIIFKYSVQLPNNIFKNMPP